MSKSLVRCAALAFLLTLPQGLCAALTLPALFSDNMVLQEGLPDPIWGRDTPGATVQVTFAGQSQSAKVGKDGRWRVTLTPMAANAAPQTLVVHGSSVKEIKGVLVGEVWLCSGQSNMTFKAGQAANAEVETAAMRYPSIRLLTVPNVASQQPQEDFKGAWQACTPESCQEFSAIGLFYGVYLHRILGVPVGLIHNSWGGSNIQSWLPRSILEENPQYADALTWCKKREARAVSPAALKKYEGEVEEYKVDLAKWKLDVEKDPLQEPNRPRKPHDPRDFLDGNLRAGNLYNGVLAPLIGYGMKGVIWYQGESNVGDTDTYRGLFAALIHQWRADWDQGTFPFYWVQLPNHGERPLTTLPPPEDGDWARLREAQSQAMSLPKTGEAVTIDLGVAHDLHPKNKMDVAARLARWPLANEYAQKMSFRSPEGKLTGIEADKVTITFTNVGSGLCIHYDDEIAGFTICGADGKWVWAHAVIQETDKVMVWSEQVPHPKFVRYAWGDNPACNLYTEEGLPAAPFRTDTFPEKPQP